MAGTVPTLFNAQWYLSQYPDIAAAVESGEMTAEQHFELHGKAEGRSAGPLFNAAAGNGTKLGFADYATVENITITGAGNVEIEEIDTDAHDATGNDSNALISISAGSATGDIRITTLSSASLKEITTGSDDDVVFNNGQQAQTINTGAGNDTIHIGAEQGGHSITTGGGEDIIQVNGFQLGNIRRLDGETGNIEDTFESKIIAIEDFDGANDVLRFNGSLRGLEYTLDSGQQGAVSAAGSLYAAVVLAEAATTVIGIQWTTFQYDGSTYIYQGNGDMVFNYSGSSHADGLIKLAGFTGVLDSNNFDPGTLIP